MIEIRHLCKRFPQSTPIKDISLTINDGDVVGIIGPSGTGKSTLLRCLNLLDKPTSGQILIDGKDITDPKCDVTLLRRKIGMVFQSFNLFEHYTVIENVMKPSMEMLGRSKQDAYDKAVELLHLVGMDNRLMQYPDMLSGGQRQRVAIARTLSMNPDVILFDEPTSALDPAMTEEVQAVIRNLSKLGKTMIIISHEMRFIKEISSRVVYLEKGVVCEEGTPEQIFNNPQQESTRRFVKRVKAFETRIEGKKFDLEDKANQIALYGYKHNIDQRIIYLLQQVFEELCGQILVPGIHDPNILFTAECNGDGDEMNITVEYNGDSFDPRESDNALSLSILENAISKANHSKVENETYTNIFTCSIKK